MNFWEIVGWGMSIVGIAALVLALVSLIQSLKRPPRCPHCRIRDAKPVEIRRPYIRSADERIDRVRGGWECNGCHVRFGFSAESTVAAPQHSSHLAKV